MTVRRRTLIGAGLAALGAGGAATRRTAGAAVVVGSPVFPLHPAPDGRFLADQSGQPFFIQGDSPQAIFQRLTPPDVEDYLARRRAQGFNTLLADPTFSNNNDGFVRPAPNGHLPFLANDHGEAYDGAAGTADFSRPDPAYWDHVDAVLARAEAHGFLVLQYVLAWGFKGRTMWRDLINFRNTAAVCRGFGEFVGRRFRHRANVMWIDGSDFDGNDTPRAPDGTSGIARALAVAQGMRAAGAMQLRTGDWSADSISTDQVLFAPLMSVNGVYTYGAQAGYDSSYYELRRAYRRTPPLPAFLKETWYEGEDKVRGLPARVRKHEWWNLLSGATAGVVYGHGDVWPFMQGRWRAALDAPGAQDMQRMSAFMRGLAWHRLVPSGLAGARRLVVSDNGQADPPRPDYVAAAQDPDGTLLLAYIPPWGRGRQGAMLDLRGMQGPTAAWWWDPTSARRQSAGRYPAGAAPRLVSPGDNDGGANDWVLDVRSAPG